MKVKTKKEMVEYLRIQEAKKWLSMVSHETWCKMHYGNDTPKSEWEDFNRNIDMRYTMEWMTIREMMSEFGIESIGYSERELLIEKGVL